MKATQQQQKALHLFFRLLAEKLNTSGLSMNTVLKPGIDVLWNETTIKECLWKPVQQAQFGKSSTRELTTKELDEVLNTIMQHLGVNFGVEQDFPSIDNIIYRQERGDYENNRPVQE